MTLKNMMIFVSCVVVLITSLFAQEPPIVPNENGQVTGSPPQSQEPAKDPNRFKRRYQAEQEKRDKAGFRILGRSDNLFPKSKTNNTANPVFNRNNFSVNEAFSQDPNIGFTPQATEKNGVNSQFRKAPKEVKEEDIPDEFKKLFQK